MDSRTLDLAAEFCELVGRTHLLEYLGLPEDASPEAAQKKLKARRKYMQGMQSNPKYRAEAIFLIKNFAALSAVLDTPIPYLKDARRRAESQHLPVLEMTIKGALAGGSLTHEQEDYLRRNAVEMGVSESTFDELLDRLAREAGVQRATGALAITPEELKSTDFYQVLGVARHAGRDEILARYRARLDEARELADPRQRDAARLKAEKAWKVLSNEDLRRVHDMAWTRTGPPARAREVARPQQISTAPPIRPRDTDPSQPPPHSAPLAPARMEVLSEARQQVVLGTAPITVSIEVRNGGEQPLRGTAQADRPWLGVITPTFDVAQQQAVRVQIDPARVSGRSDLGQVLLTSEAGETATVEFEVARPAPRIGAWIAAAAVLGGLLLAVGVGAWLLLADRTHAIDIDPWADAVLIDGKQVGAGDRVVLDTPPAGLATLTVRHGNFKPWVKDVTLAPGERTEVRLELAHGMDFMPHEGMRRANLDQNLVSQIVARFQTKIDGCLRGGLTGDAGMSGVLRIHVGPDGRPRGMELTGDGASSPSIVACVRRVAAGPVFPPLTDGDFATVRYEYAISAR